MVVLDVALVSLTMTMTLPATERLPGSIRLVGDRGSRQPRKDLGTHGKWVTGALLFVPSGES